MSMRIPILAVAAVSAMLGARAASADVFTSTIDVPNTAISGLTGPYADVSINLTSPTTADVTFTSLTNGGFTYLMGDGGTADLNVNGTYTLGPVTETNSFAGFTPTFTANVPGQVDGFGVFNLSLNNFDGFTNAATSVSFTLTDVSGTWASAANVLTANADGFDAAIHVFACATPCNTAEGATATGFAAETGGTSVPEPTTLALLGTGLIGLGLIWRRRRFES